MYLYLDLIWLLNFFIDYLLLWMTAMFRKTRFSKWRLMLASALGASYVIFLFFPPLQSVYTLGVKFMLSICIVIVAFGFGNIRRFMAHFLTFYFISFVTGGGLLAVHYLLKSQHELLEGMVATQSSGYGDLVSWWFVLVGFPVMIWFSYSRWRQIEKTQSGHDFIVDVEMILNDQSISCQGFVDTGNQLTEPFTKTPVMIVDVDILHGIVPKPLLEYVQNEQHMDDLNSLDLQDEWLRRLRVIPYRGIRQSMELMITLKPDQVVIKQDANVWHDTKVLIGINQHALSTGEEFKAIIHPELVRDQQQVKTISNEEAM